MSQVVIENPILNSPFEAPGRHFRFTEAGITDEIVETRRISSYFALILRPYDTLGSTRYVDFDTIRPTYPTDPAKCHISHVVADTGSWDQKMASVLETLDKCPHGVSFMQACAICDPA